MFADRNDAGRKLATELRSYEGKDAVVLALPRGGVLVGHEMAAMLHLPLDILAVRKIGHPFSPEYAIGAIDEQGTTIFNEAETSALDPLWLKREIDAQKEEAKRRSMVYRDGRKPLDIRDKTAIIVDDGIATGMTMRLATRYVKKEGARPVVAVPVASVESLLAIKREDVDDIIVLEPPEEFAGAVGSHYMQFEQVADDDVVRILQGI